MAPEIRIGPRLRKGNKVPLNSEEKREREKTLDSGEGTWRKGAIEMKRKSTERREMIAAAQGSPAKIRIS